MYIHTFIHIKIYKYIIYLHACWHSLLSQLPHLPLPLPLLLLCLPLLFSFALSRTSRSCRQRTKTSANSLPNGRGLVRGSFSSCLEVAQEDGQLTKPPRNYRRRMKTCANSLPKSSTCDSMASPFLKLKHGIRLAKPLSANSLHFLFLSLGLGGLSLL